jgi:hypothetical protein
VLDLYLKRTRNPDQIKQADIRFAALYLSDVGTV